MLHAPCSTLPSFSSSQMKVTLTNDPFSHKSRDTRRHTQLTAHLPRKRVKDKCQGTSTSAKTQQCPGSFYFKLNYYFSSSCLLKSSIQPSGFWHLRISANYVFMAISRTQAKPNQTESKRLEQREIYISICQLLFRSVDRCTLRCFFWAM